MSMMNSTRSRRRGGSLESFCTCCRQDASNRTYRTREKRQWQRSVSPEEFDSATDGWWTFEDFFPETLDNTPESE